MAFLQKKLPMRPRYLRVSLTGRCNLCCVYCRPGGAVDVPDEPTAEEVVFLAQCAAQEGVTKVRLTGGEPLLRGDLEEIVRLLCSVAGIEKVALTTNGIGLADRAESLKSAGLGRANVSLDTLSHARFRELTGHDRLDEALAGVEASRIFQNPKINTVLLRGVNDDEIEALVRFAAERSIVIRFIENYGCGGVGGAPVRSVSAEETARRIRAAFGELRPLARGPLAVADTYELPALGSVVGVIPSVSRPPCETCAKLRFTAEWELRSCLYAATGVRLAHALRTRDAERVRAAIREVYASKRRSGPPRGAVVSASVNLVGG